MTVNDEHAAIGELTKRYSDAKRRRAALRVEISKCRSAMASFASALMDKVEGNAPYNQPISASIPSVPDDYPTRERLTELLDDMRNTLGVIESAQKVLKDAGLDVS